MESDKSRILLVEDNEALLFNTKLKLEMSGYHVETATNGAEAIESLKTHPLPHVILSDIMMPVMDGYTFYSQVAENQAWNNIPFIFITAKSSPEDIRFAKKLGVDDYIIKPFKGEDLLASVEGKIKRSSNTQQIQSKYQKELQVLEKQLQERKIVVDQRDLTLFIVDWDEANGPTVVASYTPNPKSTIPITEVGFRLYNTASAIYDSKDWSKESHVLLHINYLEMDAVLFFMNFSDAKVRGGQKLTMFVALVKKTNYLESMRIHEKLKEIAEQFRANKQSVDLERYWKQIYDIIT